MACGQLLFGDSDDSDSPSPEDEISTALAAFGLVAATPLALDDEFWLWPENDTVFATWLAVQSQWDVADGVRYKLDYPGVKVAMELRGVGRREQQRQFALLQVMESAALNEWARHRK